MKSWMSMFTFASMFRTLANFSKIPMMKEKVPSTGSGACSGTESGAGSGTGSGAGSGTFVCLGLDLGVSLSDRWICSYSSDTGGPPDASPSPKEPDPGASPGASPDPELDSMAELGY